MLLLAQESYYSIAVKWLITSSTIILLGLILAYHALEVQVRPPPPPVSSIDDFTWGWLSNTFRSCHQSIVLYCTVLCVLYCNVLYCVVFEYLYSAVQQPWASRGAFGAIFCYYSLSWRLPRVSQGRLSESGILTDRYAMKTVGIHAFRRKVTPFMMQGETVAIISIT